MAIPSANSTLKLNEFDFLSLEEDEFNDIVLSQACKDIENELKAFDGLSELSLTQCVSEYSIPIESRESDGETEPAKYGSFKVELSATTMEPYKIENKRFGEPVSTEEMKVLIGQQENVNTKKNTAWARGVFESWRQNRNETGEEMPEFVNMTVEQMNYFLSRFVMETRKKDGTPYPPRSLYLITCGLLRHLRDCDVNDKNFLDSQNGVFNSFRKVLDARMKELLASGLGTNVKQAQPLMPEDEENLWESGVFGENSAESLQCTVFFYACKLFGLRGHDEHHDLKCEQFVVSSDQHGKYIEFTGRGSKTYKGGLKDRELTNKNIRHYCQEGKSILYKHRGSILI